MWKFPQVPDRKRTVPAKKEKKGPSLQKKKKKKKKKEIRPHFSLQRSIDQTFFHAAASNLHLSWLSFFFNLIPSHICY